MSTHEARVRRLADRVRVIVAETLETRVKDPRLGFITITDARVTNDLREATVFYTVLGSEDERADTATALESAKGILRTEVGRQTGVRHTPSLTFIADALPDTARHLDDLLAQAAAADAAVAAVSAGATYAGEADPYRAPRDEGAEDDEDIDGEVTGGADEGLGLLGQQPDGDAGTQVRSVEGADPGPGSAG